MSHAANEGLNFNPRTHVGCDSDKGRPSHRKGNFNPRTHVGCDRNTGWSYDARIHISIHAPTWGATSATVMPA